jgi:hypothetical protein
MNKFIRYFLFSVFIVFSTLTFVGCGNFANHYNKQYTVTFDSKGGTPVETITGVISFSKIPKPDDPVREGYIFLGWYDVDYPSLMWDFDTKTVYEDTTLFAKWVNANALQDAINIISARLTDKGIPFIDVQISNKYQKHKYNHDVFVYIESNDIIKYSELYELVYDIRLEVILADLPELDDLYVYSTTTYTVFNGREYRITLTPSDTTSSEKRFLYKNQSLSQRAYIEIIGKSFKLYDTYPSSSRTLLQDGVPVYETPETVPIAKGTCTVNTSTLTMTFREIDYYGIETGWATANISADMKYFRIDYCTSKSKFYKFSSSLASTFELQ